MHLLFYVLATVQPNNEAKQCVIPPSPAVLVQERNFKEGVDGSSIYKVPEGGERMSTSRPKCGNCLWIIN